MVGTANGLDLYCHPTTIITPLVSNTLHLKGGVE